MGAEDGLPAGDFVLGAVVNVERGDRVREDGEGDVGCGGEVGGGLDWGC